MPRARFTAEPVDAAFFDSAPFRLRGVFEIARPAPSVWADLTTDAPLSWCRIIDEITWTSPRPFGVGTTRIVRSLKGTSAFDERYFRWEEQRRMSFFVVAASAPLFRRFAEDYLVEPTGEGACRFEWVIAAEPRTALTNPVNRALLGTLLRDTAKHYGTTNSA